VDGDAAMADELPGRGPGQREAHAVDDVVQAGLEQLQEDLAGVAALGSRLLVVIAELPLEQAVDTLDLLLLTQLVGVVGQLAATRGGAVLAGLLLQLALRIKRPRRRLQAEVGTFAAGELALGTNVTSHGCSAPQTRRFFGGRHPLCGIGVTSMMLVIL